MPIFNMQGRRIREWEIDGLLGEGGMGQVWRARHSLLNRAFAIKVIAQELLADPKFESLFLQEAGTQAELQHPHIIPTTDFFVEDGLHCLVMPYVEGQSLEERLERNRDPQTGKRMPLPLDEALGVAQQVLRALDYAHQHRVIHRDVKPSNILLDRRGNAYLTDFGVALKMDKPRTTSTGKVVGTSAYMSPEQIQRPREMDHRTDVYSFGCVLYEMLAGCPVFETEGVEGDTDFFIKESHIKRMPEPLRKRNPKANLPEKIEAIVIKALAKNPNERFAGCGEFARALEKATEGEESLISCPNCRNKNTIKQPQLLADAKCVQCGRQLISLTGTTSPARRSPFWIVAAVVLALTALITMIGWGNANAGWKRAETRANASDFRASSLATEKEAVESELKKTKAELQKNQDRLNAYREGSIAVQNNSEVKIQNLYMRKKGESDWGPDRLGSSTIAPGGSVSPFRLSPGDYELKVKDSTGSEYSWTGDSIITVAGNSQQKIIIKKSTTTPNSLSREIQ
ncbi:MAG TPA: serine/threonine-protein kinase [Pyrinomonadaceae bacterium]|nr:serine/threonine-protein kinase [Pyrinomonadaceae bacterium]